MSKSFPELIRLLLGLCTSGPIGSREKGFSMKENQKAAESSFHSHKES